MSLYADTLKLAHAEPALRQHLVPILRQATMEVWTEDQVAALAEYVFQGLGRRGRPAMYGKNPVYYCEMQSVDFTIGAKDTPFSYEIVGVGWTMPRGEQRWDDRGPYRASTVLMVKGGEIFAMIPPTDERSGQLGGKELIRHLDRMTLEGITEAQYTALNTKLAQGSNKTRKFIAQYAREGGGKADLTKHVAQAKRFFAQWTTGETWGPAKKVILLERDFVTRNGLRIDVGTVFNIAAFKKAVETPTVPEFLGLDMFKSVARNPETGEVELGRGFDFARKGLPMTDRLEKAIQEFNDNVVAPWRAALGAEDYRRGGYSW